MTLREYTHGAIGDLTFDQVNEIVRLVMRRWSAGPGIRLAETAGHVSIINRWRPRRAKTDLRCVVTKSEQVAANQWVYGLQAAIWNTGLRKFEAMKDGQEIEEAYNWLEPNYYYHGANTTGGSVTVRALPVGYPVLARREAVIASGEAPADPPPWVRPPVGGFGLLNVPEGWEQPKPAKGPGGESSVWTFWGLNPLDISCAAQPAPAGFFGRLFR